MRTLQYKEHINVFNAEARLSEAEVGGYLDHLEAGLDTPVDHELQIRELPHAHLLLRPDPGHLPPQQLSGVSRGARNLPAMNREGVRLLNNNSCVRRRRETLRRSP